MSEEKDRKKYGRQSGKDRRHQRRKDDFFGISKEELGKLSLKQKITIISRQDRRGRALPTWGRMLVLLMILIACLIGLNIYTNKSLADVKASAVPVSEDELQFSFAGDILLGRYVETYAEKNSYTSLFENASQVWANADLVFANLECDVIRQSSSYYNSPKSIKLSATRTGLHMAAECGLNVVSIANNHAADYGRKGLEHMIESLEEYGISYAGAGADITEAGSVRYLEVYGYKVGFIAFSDVIPDGFEATLDSYGIATSYYQNLYKNVSEASQKADIVIVYAHWGEENDINVNDRQQELAHQLIESGADIVIGSHPHILQSVEEYKDGIVFYSLGNFIFDQDTRDSRNTADVLFNIDPKTGEGEFTIVPMRIENYHPYVTDNSLYLNMIQSAMTKLMDSSAYTISEDGRIHIPFTVQ